MKKWLSLRWSLWCWGVWRSMNKVHRFLETEKRWIRRPKTTKGKGKDEDETQFDCSAASNIDGTCVEVEAWESVIKWTLKEGNVNFIQMLVDFLSMRDNVLKKGIFVWMSEGLKLTQFRTFEINSGATSPSFVSSGGSSDLLLHMNNYNHSALPSNPFPQCSNWTIFFHDARCHYSWYLW